MHRLDRWREPGWRGLVTVFCIAVMLAAVSAFAAWAVLVIIDNLLTGTWHAIVTYNHNVDQQLQQLQSTPPPSP